ncbi:polysaccharide biosynthesis tyrosine autokinase [Staphylococcus canis]|uniref:non-specific protein-tyrosine kinase n=1 Tax=Staphylococcus canis TaxID=2724942 RepID=A0ABS0TA32_9STAP|nr:polysaccharide biosynthesis tyrosine autokinase [Staphylococcus canis]MBI5975594.1 polysaccharide biosynthesis tyrosine autokinase [Staphylococcus canis]
MGQTNEGQTSPQLIAHDKPKSPVSEKFRGIRSNITFAGIDEPIQSVVITSALPDTGKSTVTANLAVTYAQAGYKTLIVDGDMRKPNQHYIFNIPNHSGLSSLLVHKGHYEDAIKSTDIEGLDILTSGPIPPNPSELIATKSFQQLYEVLLNVYDFIIIDTPPVNSVTDAQLLARIVGNALIVINAEHNKRNEIIKGKKELEKTDVNILGVILNKVKAHKDSSYYAYYGEDAK